MMFMEMIREEKLEKVPGVAETLDWAHALAALHQDHLDPEMIRNVGNIKNRTKIDRGGIY